jgi:Raf kinase inhibitor-like YbhB/YbcL family protein
MRLGWTAFVTLLLCLSAPIVLNAADDASGRHFEVHSTTFQNGATFPLSMIFTFAASPGGPNICTADGSAGGNQSPELFWSGAPERTQSFAVIMYDVTASFTHWGIYNISANTTELPANAGVANSKFGSEVTNDYGLGDLSYDGPCPPTSVNPTTHLYVFTVYALDIKLPTLSGFGQFLPGAEALYNAVIAAKEGGHVLASASISGTYSAAPSGQ